MSPTALEPALRDSWAFFVHLAVVLVPLFVGGSFLVGLAEEYLPPAAVERRLRGHDEGAGNVLAAGFGAVTPFCSCSTVPVLAGLLQAGAPLGLAFSFLLASPLVNEIAVVLLFGLFGLEVTVLYVAATFAAAVVGGVAIGRLGLGDDVRDVRSLTGAREPATDGGSTARDTADCGTDCATARDTADCGTDCATARDTAGCGTDCATARDTADCGTDCATARGVPAPKTHRRRVAAAARSAWSFFVDTLPYLLVGMTVGALVHGVVPVEVVESVLGPANPLAVPLAALAGAPIYVSMSGMLPIAASLSEQGVPVGTVLAFVVGGAGVSLPNLVLLSKLFERRLLAVYAGTVVAIGTTLGLLFNAALV